MATEIVDEMEEEMLRGKLKYREREKIFRYGGRKGGVDGVMTGREECGK